LTFVTGRHSRSASAADGQDALGAVPLPPGARSVEFDDVRFSYPTAAEVSLASLEDVAVLDQAPSQEVLHG